MHLYLQPVHQGFLFKTRGQDISAQNEGAEKRSVALKKK